MMTEIEKQFFECFGIEPKKTQQIVGDGVFSNVIEEEYYPEITDRKYLELYCIQKIYLDRYIYSTCVKNLKEELLQVLINYKELKEAYTQTDKEFSEFTNKVKALFEGEE